MPPSRFSILKSALLRAKLCTYTANKLEAKKFLIKNNCTTHNYARTHLNDE